MTDRRAWPEPDVQLAGSGPVLVAAFTIGIAGGLAGCLLRRSPLVFIVPAVLMLVPGSAGFNSVLQLLTNQFVTAISIAYGLMISTIVLPRRFTQIIA
jgi:uncharacterized membrane protein YjjB (DUF3815 family)